MNCPQVWRSTGQTSAYAGEQCLRVCSLAGVFGGTSALGIMSRGLTDIWNCRVPGITKDCDYDPGPYSWFESHSIPEYTWETWLPRCGFQMLLRRKVASHCASDQNSPKRTLASDHSWMGSTAKLLLNSSRVQDMQRH